MKPQFAFAIITIALVITALSCKPKPLDIANSLYEGESIDEIDVNAETTLEGRRVGAVKYRLSTPEGAAHAVRLFDAEGPWASFAVETNDFGDETEFFIDGTFLASVDISSDAIRAAFLEQYEARAKERELYSETVEYKRYLEFLETLKAKERPVIAVGLLHYDVFAWYPRWETFIKIAKL